MINNLQGLFKRKSFFFVFELNKRLFLIAWVTLFTQAIFCNEKASIIFEAFYYFLICESIFSFIKIENIPLVV